jgi:hypothetical protein
VTRNPRTPIRNNSISSEQQVFWIDSKTSARRIDFVVQRNPELLKAVLAPSLVLSQSRSNLLDANADLHEEIRSSSRWSLISQGNLPSNRATAVIQR